MSEVLMRWDGENWIPVGLEGPQGDTGIVFSDSPPETDDVLWFDTEDTPFEAPLYIPDGDAGDLIAIAENGQLDAVRIGLSELKDVEVASPSIGEVVMYDGDNWSNHLPVQALHDLNDVSAGSPQDGEVLTWSVDSWSPVAPSLPPVTSVNQETGDVVLDIEDLDNVTDDVPQVSDVLAFNGSNWAPNSSYVTEGEIEGMVTSNDYTTIVKLTQAEYNALTPDPSVLYVVIG